MSNTEKSVGEIVRRKEREYNDGHTQISEYVRFSLSDTINTIEAYLNSKFISGETDSKGRQKPFFNIVIAAANIWFRATDIDRQNIRIRADKQTDWFMAFLATIHLRMWMRKAKFGQYLNNWGRTLARYGSAVTKIVENDGGLHISVIPFNRIIFDAIDFDANPKIEILELTPSQLRERVETHGYDETYVEELIAADQSARETLDKRKKDNQNDYIKVYEVHMKGPKSLITENEAHKKISVQQMHVISYVSKRKGKKYEYDDFTLYKGQEKHDPYRIDHLIEEDGRSIAIGAVEHLFESQWMVNHSQKAIKDQLDLASKLIFQTSDGRFLGNNALTDIENGDIMVHSINEPLTMLNNQSHDTEGWSNYSITWKQLGNEINGVSEAMLGAQPKSGTAWRQTEALLNESYSLFELMTENKGLAIEDMMRSRILPWIRTKMDTTEEVSATCEAHEINRIDARYVKNKARKETKKELKRMLLEEEDTVPTSGLQDEMNVRNETQVQEQLSEMGNTRYFKPSDIESKTWKEAFKDMEWDLEVDITGESQNVQEAMTTLNTALKTVVTPGFDQNPKAQAIVGRILELSGSMSPVEYESLPSAPPQPSPMAQPSPQAAQSTALNRLSENTNGGQ